MCHALYIASDKSLPLIEWVEAEPAFCVSELQEHEEVVRKHFALSNVVYAGSFEGCSCGFVYDDEPIDDNEFEQQYDQQARESVRKLLEYVSKIVEDGSVEMFACWESELGNDATAKVIIDRSFFTGKEFGFDDGSHYTVMS